MKSFRIFLVRRFHHSITILIVMLSGCSRSKQSFPVTELRPVTETYYGVNVVDNYRWLDSINDPAVRKWTDAQNAFSRSYFDKTGSLAAIQERLKQLYSDQTVNYSSLVHRKRYFALKTEPPKNQPFIVAFDSPESAGAEKAVFDPNVLDPNGGTAIDWFVPSRDGRFVAASLSENGSEDGSVHVFDVGTGKETGEVIPRVQFPTGGGSLEWDRNDRGFYYTRYPQGNERPAEERSFFQQIYYHALGTPLSKDFYVLGREFPKIAEIALSSSDDGKYILAQVANGDGGEFAHYLLGPTGKWTQVTQFADKVSHAVFGDGVLYLLSRLNAPRGRILSLPLSSPKLAHAAVLVAESDVSIANVIPGKRCVYVLDMDGGPSRVRVLGLKDKTLRTIPILPVSAVHGSLVSENDDLLFKNETYLIPPSWYRYNRETGAVVKIPLGTVSSADFSAMEVNREFATSKDGTRIPMNIIYRKGIVHDGKNPTILYGYGGFNISEVPSFNPAMLAWLEQGGIYVRANLRGGSEFGEDWHNQGRLLLKQNVFDDFIACAEHLIESKYTSSTRLAIEGGSNGGLLMGAALTQRPDLFRAVLSFVGIYDMLRVELFSNGAFNVTEFGSVKNPDQFKALYAYSPYHHVVDGTAYPAVLFMTGDNDGRVDPANSRKMIARLQAATSSSYPLLLRTDSNAGHGIGTGLTTFVAQESDAYAFLFDQLGVEYKSVALK